MKKPVYDLDLFQALKIVLEGGAVRGENFSKGYFLRLDQWGKLVIVDVKEYYAESDSVFLKALNSQKFRELTVLTLKETSV